MGRSINRCSTAYAVSGSPVEPAEAGFKSGPDEGVDEICLPKGPSAIDPQLIMRIPSGLWFLTSGNAARYAVLVSLSILLGVVSMNGLLRERLKSSNKALLETRNSLAPDAISQPAYADIPDFTVALPQMASSLAFARQLQSTIDRAGGQLSALALSKPEQREQTLGSVNVTGSVLGGYDAIKRSLAATVTVDSSVVVQRLSIRRLEELGDNLEAAFDILLLSNPSKPLASTPLQRKVP